MTFLFDPKQVANQLSSLPHLRAALGDPHREGKPSEAFSTARKTQREIYRVLGNAPYPLLRDLLETLDFCLGRGFSQPTILRTRARKSFAEALAELSSAEHFLLRGLTVQGLDEARDQAPVPDLILAGTGPEVAVEVCCPRQWEGLSDFLDDFRDLLMNLDLAFDYEFDVYTNQLEHFDEGRLLQPHPQELADHLAREIRDGLIVELVDELAAHLDGAGTAVRVKQDHAGLNLKIVVEVSSVEPSQQRLPIRQGAFSGPSITGHSPGAMFSRIVERVVRKAARGQAVGHAPLSLLLVDLTRSELDVELSHPVYREQFEEAVTESLLGRNLQGYDMIAFCQCVAWRQELCLHYLMSEDSVAKGTPGLLFGEQAR